MAKLDIAKALRVLDLFGYPCRQTKWITWGGGAIQEFDDDSELIEFAEDMTDRIMGLLEENHFSDDPITKQVKEILKEGTDD